MLGLPGTSSVDSTNYQEAYRSSKPKLRKINDKFPSVFGHSHFLPCHWCKTRGRQYQHWHLRIKSHPPQPAGTPFMTPHSGPQAPPPSSFLALIRTVLRMRIVHVISQCSFVQVQCLNSVPLNRLDLIDAQLPGARYPHGALSNGDTGAGPGSGSGSGGTDGAVR